MSKRLFQKTGIASFFSIAYAKLISLIQFSGNKLTFDLYPFHLIPMWCGFLIFPRLKNQSF
jgi:hypothetical protein